MSDPNPSIAYVALGGNVGDRAENLHRALEAMRRSPGITLGPVSAFVENEAVGGPAGSPPFLNAAAQIGTTLAPPALLARLLEIERTLGRERRIKWGPRTIDLDLLLYADVVLSTADLTLPHPLMHQRRFVLQPLAEIAPDVVHPVMRTTVRELLEGLE